MRKKRVPLYRCFAVYHESPETFNALGDFELDEHHGGAAIRLKNIVHIYLPHEDYSAEMTDLAHEAFHAADMVAEYVGIEYKEGSGNEAVAYLVSWFTGFILDEINHLYQQSKEAK